MTFHTTPAPSVARPSVVFRYPTRPENVNENIVQPTEAFRKEVIGVLKSIIVFIITYILLVCAAIVFAGLSVLLGYWIFTLLTNLWGIVIALGCVGLGGMVLYFLFKFVFKTKTVDKSDMVEIFAKDHPALFEFIKKLAAETETPMPKRVYLSNNVNASVFYDSSFWSMFFPVRKNLNIGLGLVNCVNISEFKAVLAHEFGHFSQKSMRLGSYVYQANHIIHDMLFDNDDYQRTLQQWASVSNIFYFFAEVTSVVVRIIIEILEQVYVSMNERYMALSRQMEFHADAVAASVSGSSPLISALYRLEFAEGCYQNVIGHYNEWIKSHRKGINIYQDQKEVMNYYAKIHGLRIENGLVQVSPAAFDKYKTSRVVIKDQWASHPENAEREAQLRSYNIQADIVTDSAWSLFSDVEGLQASVTSGMYESVQFAQPPLLIDGDTFAMMFRSEVERFSFNPGYKGFYDNREIAPFDCNHAIDKYADGADLTLPGLLDDKTLNLPHVASGIKADIDVLERIEPKSSNVKTFDFEGIRYERKDARQLVKKLKEELHHVEKALTDTDQKIFALYWRSAASAGKQQEAIDNYSTMFTLSKQVNEDINLLSLMIRDATQLFNSQVTESLALHVTGNMKRDGDEMRKKISEFLDKNSDAPTVSSHDRELLQSFVNGNSVYFSNARFHEEAITLYLNALQTFGTLIADQAQEHKKRTLEEQFSFLS